jgi:hypothetical protein
MAESIKTVTDKSQFEMILVNFFRGKEVFLKTKSGNLKIQFLGFNDSRVAFRIPFVKNIPETIIIFTRHNYNTIYASLNTIENNEDTFIFLPVKFQIIAETRKEDRTQTQADTAGRNIVYMANVMSDFAMKHELTVNHRKVDNIREIIEFDLKKQFERIRLYFISEGKLDVRMKYIIENGMPIHIMDLNSPPDPKREKAYNSYINEVYLRDQRLVNAKEFVSEVTVPFLFKNMIPFGYLQVNSTQSISEGLFSVVKRAGVIINELFKKEKLFVLENDRFIVSDMSKGGLGVVFKDRRQIRFFRQDSVICFDLLLPTSKKASMGGIVRNITFLDNGIIKAGIQIKDIDALSEVNYDEYLESAGIE